MLLVQGPRLQTTVIGSNRLRRVRERLAVHVVIEALSGERIARLRPEGWGTMKYFRNSISGWGKSICPESGKFWLAYLLRGGQWRLEGAEKGHDKRWHQGVASAFAGVRPQDSGKELGFYPDAVESQQGLWAEKEWDAGHVLKTSLCLLKGEGMWSWHDCGERPDLEVMTMSEWEMRLASASEWQWMWRMGGNTAITLSPPKTIVGEPLATIALEPVFNCWTFQSL